MAYARNPRRRRAAPRRRSNFRRKTVYRRKKTTRVSRPLRKKILKVSAVKKVNTMAATTTAEATTPTGFIDLPNFLNGIIWCPTYMNLEQSAITPHARQRETILFRGLVDKWIVQSGDWADIYHRRIVFWHDARIAAAIPVQSTFSDSTFFRPLNLLDFTTGDGAVLLRTVFKGTQDVDWRNILNAKVDTTRIKIVSDKTRKVRSAVAHTAQDASTTDPRIYPTGTARYNSAHFPNRMIRFDDEETGAFDRQDDPDASQGSPWATLRGGSAGNLYVFDLFSVNASSESTALPVELLTPTIHVDSSVYWHEK